MSKSKKTPAATATARLDSLTRAHTAFRTFEELIAGGHSLGGKPIPTSYFPSLYPGKYPTAEEIADKRELADAYDAAQIAKGDERRADRGSADYWVLPQAIIETPAQ